MTESWRQESWAPDCASDCACVTVIYEDFSACVTVIYEDFIGCVTVIYENEYKAHCDDTWRHDSVTVMIWLSHMCFAKTHNLALLCSLIQIRVQEDPPRRTWYKFFEGGPLTHGSWWGNIVNRKPPRGGGVSFDQIYQKNSVFVEKSPALCQKILGLPNDWLNKEPRFIACHLHNTPGGTLFNVAGTLRSQLASPPKASSKRCHRGMISGAPCNVNTFLSGFSMSVLIQCLLWGGYD